MKKSEIVFGLIRIPIDYLMAVSAFIIAYKIRRTTDLIPGVQLPLNLDTFQPYNEYIFSMGKAGIALIAIFALNGMYSLKSTSSTSRELSKVVYLSVTWLLFIITYFFFKRAFPFSRLILIYSCVLSIVLISTGRLLIRATQNFLLKKGYGTRKVAFIGNNSIAQDFAKRLNKEKIYQCIGVIDKGGHQKSSLPYLGSLEDLEKIVKKHSIEELIHTKSQLSHTEDTRIFDFCQTNHIQYSFVPDMVEVQRTNIDVQNIRGIPLIKLKPTPLDGWGRVLKRTFDIIGALAGFLILSPIFFITALAIKLDSKGPILFTKLDDGSPVKRVGQYGTLFKFYKFRSMRPNSHSMRYNELAQNDTRKDSPLVKIKNDPRVTRVGKFIRKTSIDELPQLWNVLNGTMSLVGPRPHLPEEVEKYEKHHKFVLTIKPGITGLAQISGRSDLDFEDEVKLDRYYIENWSIWKDIKIIIKTVFVLFKKYEE